MSTSRSKISDQEDVGSASLSVLDFLYNDSRRVGSFLSQFEVGHLSEITQTKQASRGKEDATETSVSGGLPSVAGGRVKNIEQVSMEAQEGSHRVYDPYWANARAFLDHLSDSALIQRDISVCGIGQFVLVSGRLVLLDLESLKPVWELPAIQARMRQGNEPFEESQQSGNRAQRRAQHARARRPQPPGNDTDIGIAVLPHMHHSAQARLIGSDFTTWSSLRSDALVGTISDLVLKHGAQVAGTWSILGILDAKPDEGSGELDAFDLQRLGLSDDNGAIAQVAVTLAPLTRGVMGRPTSSYGLTPLLIFREVS